LKIFVSAEDEEKKFTAEHAETAEKKKERNNGIVEQTKKWNNGILE